MYRDIASLSPRDEGRDRFQKGVFFVVVLIIFHFIF